MKKVIRLTENDLHRIVRNSVKKILKEEHWMSDEDISSQYSDFNITYLEVKPSRTGGWVGTLEVEFPNADEIDFDSSKVDNFSVYDSDGKRIGFEHWYPDNISNQFKEIIRKEIQNQKNNGVKTSPIPSWLK